MGEFEGGKAESAVSATNISIKLENIRKHPKNLQIISDNVCDIETFIEASKYVNFYGITVSPCSQANKMASQQDPQILSRFAESVGLSSKYVIHKLNFEIKTEKKNGDFPHIHYTVLKKGSLQRFYLKGYSIYITPVYSYEGWISYCKKDENKDDYSFV